MSKTSMSYGGAQWRRIWGGPEDQEGVSMNIDAAVAKCIRALAPDVKKATVYLDEKTVVSVCRRFKYTVRSLSRDFVLKIGRPNYKEQEFIKRCKKAGEPLPVRKVQLKFWPVKKKAS